MNVQDNEHIAVHDLRGFVADDLLGAFDEAYAISQGTKCKQFLFSLSLSPPEKESVPVDVFEQAIAVIEEKLGLKDQPRALVFHEKEGRRHAHCVWSRINANEMKAINLSHYKLKLRDISRELYLEHGWQMPRGLANSEERNPLNFSQAEWQQAKRTKQDPRVIKELFQDCWAISDSRGAFSQALEERGFYLAKGDRRGFVAVDWRGEVYAISKWTGIKTKEVRAKLGDAESLPSVKETKNLISKQFSDKLRKLVADTENKNARVTAELHARRTTMVQHHRNARSVLRTRQKARQIAETKDRASRLPTGLKALWFRLTGKYRPIKEENESLAAKSEIRDRIERQTIIEQQLRERRALQHEILQKRHHHEIAMKALNREIATFLAMSGENRQGSDEMQQVQDIQRKRRISRDM